MKTLFKSLRWAFGLAFLIVSIIQPESIFGAGGVSFAMAQFITSSVTWEGKQNFDYLIKPMFIGKSPWETQGVRVIPDVQSTLKLNYIGSSAKVLKAYTKGFSGSSIATYTQRDLDVVRMQAEGSQDSEAFYGNVYEQLLQLGEWDEVNKAPILKAMIMKVWTEAIESDVYREFWLNDPNKQIVTSGVITAAADTDYNAFTGMWKRLIDNASTTPTADQIYRYQVVDGAIAQVDTVTLTGTSGTCNVTVGGTAYLATFDTNLNTTHANFVALHAPALALRGITLTGTTTAIFTSAVPGQPTPTPVVSAFVTGDLSGGNVATIANTAPSALAAGESLTILENLTTRCPRVLKGIAKNKKVLLVDDAVLENYVRYQESLGTEISHNMLKDSNGDIHEFVSYHGITMIPMGWAVSLDEDFPHATGELYAYPHRVIYCENGMLVMGLDGKSEYAMTKSWYNPDEQENRFRTQLKAGTQYVHPNLIAVAF